MPRTQKSTSLYIDTTTPTTPAKSLDKRYPFPPDMDLLPDNVEVPNDIRPYIPDGPIYMLDKRNYKSKKNKLIPPTYTYCTPRSALWFNFIQMGIKDGTLPFRDFSVDVSTPTSSHTISYNTSTRDFKSHDDIDSSDHNNFLNLQQNIQRSNQHQWNIINTQIDSNTTPENYKPINQSSVHKRKRSSTSYPDDSLEVGSSSNQY